MKKQRESTRKKGPLSRVPHSGRDESSRGVVDLDSFRIKKELHSEGFHLGVDGQGKLALLLRISR